MTEPLITGTERLPDEQKAGIEKIVDFLKGEEVKSRYVVKEVPGHIAPWPSGTVRFQDGTDRVWFVRPDGSYSWKTY